jgi:hypothetical protein
MRRAIVAAFLAFLCLGCTTMRTSEPNSAAGPSLVGLWERVGTEDPFAGMRVRVERLTDGALLAVIVSLPQAAVDEGMSAGLVKWKILARNADGTYLLHDLSMSDGEFWWEMILSFTSADAIKLRDVESQDETGAEQDWVRRAETAPRGST